MIRTGITTSGQVWGTATGEAISSVNRTVDYSLTGKNVDIIIHDSGVLQYHPEFMDSNGQSRVRDVILDGPFYIDPEYFISNNLTYVKADGRIGITTTSAKNWWENGFNRSAKFFSIGTISLPAFYTEPNALGNSLNGTNTIGDGHGTACAGLAAGKNFGLSFEANIWSIAAIADSTGLGIEVAYDAIKLFHLYKSINPSIGVKNPTIVNGSWGYQTSFTSGETVFYRFRGATGSFTGNASTTDLATAMKNGLNNQVSGAFRSFTSPSYTSSTDTAGSEMIDAGVIYVSAAGNNNQKVDAGSNSSDRLNYLKYSDGYCNHRDWLNPHGIGWKASEPEYHPVINVGALDDAINVETYSERKASYSNNGTGIDVWAPADETISAGMAGGNLPSYEDFARFDSVNFYDCRFNGTSAAAPVVTGLIGLYLETHPTATNKEVKEWLLNYGSTVVPTELLQNTTTDDTTTNYWLESYNLRGAPRRIAYNPYASSIQPSLGNEE
jgi:subtilisin family serine protease